LSIESCFAYKARDEFLKLPSNFLTISLDSAEEVTISSHTLDPWSNIEQDQSLNLRNFFSNQKNNEYSTVYHNKIKFSSKYFDDLPYAMVLHDAEQKIKEQFDGTGYKLFQEEKIKELITMYIGVSIQTPDSERVEVINQTGHSLFENPMITQLISEYEESSIYTQYLEEPTYLDAPAQ